MFFIVEMLVNSTLRHSEMLGNFVHGDALYSLFNKENWHLPVFFVLRLCSLSSDFETKILQNL